MLTNGGSALAGHEWLLRYVSSDDQKGDSCRGEDNSQAGKHVILLTPNFSICVCWGEYLFNVLAVQGWERSSSNSPKLTGTVRKICFLTGKRCKCFSSFFQIHSAENQKAPKQALKCFICSFSFPFWSCVGKFVMIDTLDKECASGPICCPCISSAIT